MKSDGRGNFSNVYVFQRQNVHPIKHSLDLLALLLVLLLFRLLRLIAIVVLVGRVLPAPKMNLLLPTSPQASGRRTYPFSEGGTLPLPDGTSLVSNGTFPTCPNTSASARESTLIN